MTEALLPAVATPMEVAVSRVGAARRPIPAHLVKTVWNPATCPVDLLPILANQLSVDVWDEAWDEAKKRRVIRRAIPVQKIKGTLAALREYAGYRDAEIVSVVRPPQRFFAGGSATPSETAAWLAALPEIRVYVEGSRRSAGRGLFAGGPSPLFFVGRFAMPSTAALRAGERVVLRRGGVETPLGSARWDGTVLTISLVGAAGPRAIAGRAGRLFACPSIASTRICRIGLDGADDLVAIHAGGRLQSLRPRLASDRVRHPRALFAGCVVHRRFAGVPDASMRVHRSFSIVDESAPRRPRRSTAFADVTRLAVAARTAELRVSIPGRGARLGFFAGRRVGGFALPSRAAARVAPPLEALAAAARLTDTILIDTNVHRPLTAGSGIFAGQRHLAGQWTRA